MKVLTYQYNGQKAVGILKKDGSEVVPVNYLGCGLLNMTEFIASMTEQKQAKLEKNAELMLGIPLSDVRILSPIVHPKQDVICLGINYYAHAEEAARFHDEAFGGERPQPIYFSKRVNRAVGDGEEIDGHFDIVEGLDYEAELAVIIGKDAKNVAEKDAFSYVFGYTILNDISANNGISARVWMILHLLDLGLSPKMSLKTRLHCRYVLMSMANCVKTAILV